jgi:hypothetical protein
MRLGISRNCSRKDHLHSTKLWKTNTISGAQRERSSYIHTEHLKPHEKTITSLKLKEMTSLEFKRGTAPVVVLLL